MAVGTPAYMAPEQAAARRRAVGRTTDVYGLGAILYELLTGRPPFRAPTAAETLIQVMESAPEAPLKLNPRVLPDLQTVCMKCLEKHPERRYGSARELAEDLGRFLNHEPILGQPTGRGRRAWAWCARHPWAVSAIIALACLNLIFLTHGLWEQNRRLTSSATHPGEPIPGKKGSSSPGPAVWALSCGSS